VTTGGLLGAKLCACKVFPLLGGASPLSRRGVSLLFNRFNVLLALELALIDYKGRGIFTFLKVRSTALPNLFPTFFLGASLCLIFLSV